MRNFFITILFLSILTTTINAKCKYVFCDENIKSEFKKLDKDVNEMFDNLIQKSIELNSNLNNRLQRVNQDNKFLKEILKREVIINTLKQELNFKLKQLKDLQ